MKNTLFALAGMISIAAAGPASATLFDYTPSNLGVADSTAYNSVGMSADGISVNITAYTIDNNGSGTINSMSQITGSDVGVYVSSSNNLGVSSNSSSSIDSHSLDGGGSGSTSDPDEGLLFSFDQTVRLDYINFDRFHDNGDDFNLTVDGVLKLIDFNGNDSSLLATQVPGQFDEYNFFNIVGQEFLFWADSDSDSFRIDRMIVSSVVSTPEPAMVLLLATGLIGFGLNRRRLSA